MWFIYVYILLFRRKQTKTIQSSPPHPDHFNRPEENLECVRYIGQIQSFWKRSVVPIRLFYFMHARNNFQDFCCLLIFFTINLFFKYFFQEFHHRGKQFRSRSGPTFCRAPSGYKPFAKTLADKKLTKKVVILVSGGSRGASGGLLEHPPRP